MTLNFVKMLWARKPFRSHLILSLMTTIMVLVFPIGESGTLFRMVTELLKYFFVMAMSIELLVLSHAMSDPDLFQSKPPPEDDGAG